MNKKWLLMLISFVLIILVITFISSSDSSNSYNDILNEEEFKRLVYNLEIQDPRVTTYTHDLNTGETTVEVDTNFEKPDIEEIKAYVLDDLIRQTVLVEEAMNRNITVTDSEVDTVIEELMDTFTKVEHPIELMAFYEVLEVQDMTVEEYFYDWAYEGYRNILMINKLSEEIMQSAATYEEGVEKFRQLENEKVNKFKKRNKKLIEQIYNSY